ncbi:MAG: NAD(P)-dependent oxidoreductase [Phreatobacter sp.]|uniref:NAD(P)-dependent oxidoreductase n=1 Tax=Phreatobacter sp. TaxID=1966341 RepID=UPI0040372F40
MGRTGMTVGFIGLGKMGRGMASNLQTKGFSLMVHDVVEAPVAALEALGARRGTPAEIAAACDIVVTVLPTGKEVGEVILAPGGVLDHAKPGTLILDLSTIDPDTTDRLHEEARRRGMTAVDAPIGRLAWHADRGQSLFMVGADDADYQRVLPLLNAMGTTIHHSGGPGAGTRMKLVNNYLAIILCQLNAEALSLSQRFGLDLVKTLDVLYGTTATNGQLKVNWPNKVLAGDTEPGFSIDLAHKDLTLIIQAANAARVPVPVAAAAREAFSQARARGYGQNDFSAMVDVACDISQIERARLPKGYTPPA